MLDKNAIGRSSPPTLNEVEKGAIRRFAEALGDFNPMYYDEEYEEEVAPVIAHEDIPGGAFLVPRGRVAGVNQTVVGL